MNDKFIFPENQTFDVKLEKFAGNIASDFLNFSTFLGHKPRRNESRARH